jgi:hypothetical protein
MTIYKKHQDGVYRAMPMAYTWKSRARSVQEAQAPAVNERFELWYSLWKVTGKRFISKEFQQK